MLTRSPVPARSPSASPSSFHASFHYVPSSPQKRSPKLPTAVSRRPSTSSPLGMTKSADPPPPKPPATNYVGVDAATQYSPMEQYDYFFPRDTQAKPPLVPGTSAATANHHHHHQHEGTPTSHNTAAGAAVNTPGASSSQAARPTTQSPGSVEQPPMLKAPHPLLSPNKRRNSEGPGSLVGEASGSGQVAQGLPKRAKPDVVPPKVLPVRYELCAIEDVVVLIANMLSELIETNDALAMRSGQLTRFHSR